MRIPTETNSSPLRFAANSRPAYFQLVLIGLFGVPIARVATLISSAEKMPARRFDGVSREQTGNTRLPRDIHLVGSRLRVTFTGASFVRQGTKSDRVLLF